MHVCMAIYFRQTFKSDIVKVSWNPLKFLHPGLLYTSVGQEPIWKLELLCSEEQSQAIYSMEAKQGLQMPDTQSWPTVVICGVKLDPLLSHIGANATRPLAAVRDKPIVLWSLHRFLHILSSMGQVPDTLVRNYVFAIPSPLLDVIASINEFEDCFKSFHLKQYAHGKIKIKVRRLFVWASWGKRP